MNGDHLFIPGEGDPTRELGVISGRWGMERPRLLTISRTGVHGFVPGKVEVGTVS